MTPVSPGSDSSIAEALVAVEDWPVDHAAAAVARPNGQVTVHGPTDRRFELASVSKLLTAYAVLIACEEGSVGLDQPLGQPGCTVRHLLAHAGGYPFEGAEPIAQPGTRRIYSNTGFELLADHIASATGVPFGDYLTEAVLDPLGMTDTDVDGSAAKGFVATLDDLVAFAGELLAPRLVAATTFSAATGAQFPALSGVVPGFGRFDPCPWGLGFELKGAKSPHWMAPDGSPETFGHFGGAGTLVWVDPRAQVSLVVLTDRSFGEWAHQRWPSLGSAVLAARHEERDR